MTGYSVNGNSGNHCQIYCSRMLDALCCSSFMKVSISFTNNTYFFPSHLDGKHHTTMHYLFWHRFPFMGQISNIKENIRLLNNSTGKTLLAGKGALQQLIHVIFLFSVTEEIHHNDRHTQKKIHSLSSSHVSVEHVLETKLTPPSSTQIYGYYLTLKAQRAEETGSDSIHTILFLLLFWMNTLNWFLLKQNVFTSSWLVSSTNTWQSECSRLRLAAFFSHLKIIQYFIILKNVCKVLKNTWPIPLLLFNPTGICATQPLTHSPQLGWGTELER